MNNNNNNNDINTNEKNNDIERDTKDVKEQEVNSELEAVKEELEEQAREYQDKDEDREKEIEQYKKEIAELTDKYLRVSAEFQNYRRRTEKEKNEIFKYGSEKVIVDLLSVLDNFERAISSVEHKDVNNNFLDGIKMIYKQFKDILEKHGVKEIVCEGEEFDPNYHHAVLQEEVENKESNIILEVYEKGYTLNGKVIRPSMVKVSK